ncbi:MAG: CBS domain-containing protein [Planctomycetota bacterium]|jgi:signal-transduction protein with cAMP-binding, CBS, and nucleotidyltransferase domain
MYEITDHPANIATIGRSTTVKAAAIEMLTHKIGCLIVNDEDGKLAGIVTERDIVSQAIISPKGLDETTVGEIMTKQVVSCFPGTSTSEAREIMTANKIRHLPMVDNGVVVGMLSARDVMEQQLLEDRAAAEEVTTLSNCLKSIDLDSGPKSCPVSSQGRVYNKKRRISQFQRMLVPKRASEAPRRPAEGGYDHGRRCRRRII